MEGMCGAINGRTEEEKERYPLTTPKFSAMVAPMDQSMLEDSDVKLTHLLAKSVGLPLWCACIQISTVIQSFQRNAPIKQYWYYLGLSRIVFVVSSRVIITSSWRWELCVSAMRYFRCSAAQETHHWVHSLSVMATQSLTWLQQLWRRCNDLVLLLELHLASLMVVGWPASLPSLARVDCNVWRVTSTVTRCGVVVQDCRRPYSANSCDLRTTSHERAA